MVQERFRTELGPIVDVPNIRISHDVSSNRMLSASGVYYNLIERFDAVSKISSDGREINSEKIYKLLLSLSRSFCGVIYMALDVFYSPHDFNSWACKYRTCFTFDWNTTNAKGHIDSKIFFRVLGSNTRICVIVSKIFVKVIIYKNSRNESRLAMNCLVDPSNNP